jgi:hypothetical protein
MPVRAAHRRQIFDVHHSHFMREPMKVVRELYDYFYLRLTPATEAKMQERIVQQPERQHGEHRYDLQTFGLTKEEIEERYGEYMAEFGLGSGAH